MTERDPRLPITLDPNPGLLTESVPGQTFTCDGCGAAIVEGEDELHREARRTDGGIERTVRCGECHADHMAEIDRELGLNEGGADGDRDG